MGTTEGNLDSPQTPQRPHPSIAALLMVLALIAALRLPGITRPLLGNFATKQAVYGMIARNWALGRAEMAYPTLDVLRGGQRAFQMVEFPVSVYATAAGWHTFGGSLDVWGRATSVLLSLGSVTLLYLFVGRRHSTAAAVSAALALALSPVSIVFGQSFILQPSLVFFTLATFFAMDRWLDASDGRAGRCHGLWLLAAGIGLALLLLTKIYMLAVLLPLAVMVFREARTRGRMVAGLVVLAAAVLPAAWWYTLAYQAAEPGGPLAERIFYSVRHSTEAHHPPHPLLFSPDFYRGLLDDLTGVVLTPLGFALALAGLLSRAWRRYALWLAVSVLLVLALPRKFHEMNYYWMAVLPPLCILVGLGWEAVYEKMRIGRAGLGVAFVLALGLSLRYAVKPAFVTPDEDRGVLPAAAALQGLATDANEPVVAMHGTSLDLLYYCNRPGWVIAPDGGELTSRLEECRRKGARFAVVVGDQPTELGIPVAKGEGFRIYRLP